MKKIILASTSPRRIEILKSLGFAFDIISPNYDEKIVGLKFSYEAIENIALNKAISIKNMITEPALIISADTVVIAGNDVLGKPINKEQALIMLEKLNNDIHKVVTSIAIIDTQSTKQYVESTTSEVCFSNISKENLINYIEKYNPLDKAGSYGIQELPEYFVKEIIGDFDNIVGLPTRTLTKMINKINNLS